MSKGSACCDAQSSAAADRNAKRTALSAIVAAAVVVDAGAIVELRTIDAAATRAPGPSGASIRPALNAMRRHFERHAIDDGAAGDAAVARRDQRDVVAEPAERLRQRRGHIGQPARLRERLRLGGDHQDAEDAASSAFGFGSSASAGLHELAQPCSQS